MAQKMGSVGPRLMGTRGARKEHGGVEEAVAEEAVAEEAVEPPPRHQNHLQGHQNYTHTKPREAGWFFGGF